MGSTHNSMRRVLLTLAAVGGFGGATVFDHWSRGWGGAMARIGSIAVLVLIVRQADIQAATHSEDTR